MTRLWVIAPILLSIWLAPAQAQNLTDRPDLEHIFRSEGLHGAFVLLDVHRNAAITVNSERAKRRFISASTFKIANSLIALELGALRNIEEIIPYGGQPQPIKIWERDMPLRDAFAVSNVPVFQELARRVGMQNYAEQLAALPYGNAEVGTMVERFWLEGPLKISALEQAEFLARLATQNLPFSKKSQADVRDIAKLATRDRATLFGKTGWSRTPDPDIGWFVGWVEEGPHIHTFALNIDINTRQDARKRKSLARVFLAELGIFPR